MKNILLLFVTFFSLSTLTAQSFSFDDAFKQAYLAGDKALWQKELSKLEEAHQASGDEALLFYLAKGQYYSASAFMAADDQKGAKGILSDAAANTKKYLKKHEESGAAHALLTAIYGMQIGLSPMKGMSLGSKSNDHLNKALQYGPEDPFVLMQKGSNLYYTPALWGGDPEASIDYLTQARELLQSSQEKCSIDWLNTMAVLGQAYHHEKEHDKALATYQSALKEATNFGWVKYNLLPRLKSEM